MLECLGNAARTHVKTRWQSDYFAMRAYGWRILVIGIEAWMMMYHCWVHFRHALLVVGEKMELEKMMMVAGRDDNGHTT